MSSFAPRVAAPRASPPDPNKHVNYNLGMVLGVDDFTQEFAYLSGRDQWLARDLLGYGTVWGLRVFTEMESRGPRLVVDSGVAVSPHGQLIRVPAAQCAFLNDWLRLETTKTELVNHLGSPPSDRVRIYVALCYRECPTDEVPIPGEPCRSEEDLMMPSRLTDNFVLELRFTPPDQREEDALRDFVAWLSQIEISDTPGRSATVEEFLQAVRHAAQPTGSPPGSPHDFMFGSPPASLRISSAKACEYLRAAFRVWTTELRPRWRPTFGGGGCTDTPLSEPNPEACVMLAEVVLPLTRTPGGDWAIDDTRPVGVNEERRPFLLHLRLLQEWLLCGRHEVSVIPPGDDVLPETAFGQGSNAGIATEYSRADHTHGTPPDPIPRHRADPSAHVLAGDVTGDIGNTTVARLQNVAVDATRPGNAQVLTFVAEQRSWQARNLPAGLDPITPADTVVPETEFGQPDNGGNSTEYSRADHTHGTPTLPNLRGDVRGAIDNTTVARLCNANVAAAITPTDNQVLTFQGGQWQPADVPQSPSGEFVAHPPDKGSYAIVAAGIVSGVGSSSPVYNGLNVDRVYFETGSGDLMMEVSFLDYVMPDDNAKHQYIVKALPVLHVDPEVPNAAFVVYFDSFAKGFFVLRLIRIRGQIPNIEQANSIEVMLEVSRYPYEMNLPSK